MWLEMGLNLEVVVPPGFRADLGAAPVGTWARPSCVPRRKEYEQTVTPESCPPCPLCSFGNLSPHFANEKTEVQRGEVTCLRSYTE